MKKYFELNKEELEKLIIENQKKQCNEYIIKNRGFVTASKLKLFEKSPEAFFVRYILEQELEIDKQDEKTSYKIGTAVDDFISFGEMEFNKKYFLSEKKMLKNDWLELASEITEVTGKEKVAELKEIVLDGKKVLSESETETFNGIINEWKRQPLFDINGNYETQKVVTAKYKSIDLKVTLDRLGVEKGLLRDMKTTNNLSKFEYAIMDYGYDFSMSTYFLICKLAYNKDFQVILDACQTTFPYPSSSMIMSLKKIAETVETRIMPTLDKLNDIYEKWEKTKDPSVWITPGYREYLYDIETYGEMKTTIQTEFEFIN